MRICLINPTILMRRPIAQLAILLAKNGHAVTIITPGSPEAIDTRQNDYLADNIPNIKVIRLPSREIKKVLWSYPKSFLFFHALKKEISQQDVVHVWAPFYIISFYPIWLKFIKKIKTPIILTFDTFPGFSFHMTSRYLDLALRYFIIITKPILNRASAITLYSEQLLPYAKEIGLRLSIVRTIPTGITLASSAPPENPNLETVPMILYVGLLNGRKGIDTLLKTAKIVQEQGINCQFTIVGSGPEKSLFENQTHSLGLKNVRFIGATTEVALYYKKARIFFLPSRGEGLPGVVMEAMGYGLPVVASNIPCISDLVKNNGNGFLNDAEKPEEFAASLIRLLQNKDLCQKFGSKSAELIKSFDWIDILPRYLRLYSEVTRHE